MDAGHLYPSVSLSEANVFGPKDTHKPAGIPRTVRTANGEAMTKAAVKTVECTRKQTSLLGYLEDASHRR